MARSFDLPGLLQALGEGGFSPTGQTRRSVYFTCPRCDKPKIAVIRDNGYWKCWHCADDGMRGWPEDLLVALLRVDRRYARELLGAGPPPSKVLDLPPPWGPVPEAEEDTIPILSWPHHAVPVSHPQGARGRGYLEGRGVPAAVQEEYGVRYSQQWRRVLFPMVVHGFLAGWQGRSVVPTPTDPAQARRFIKAKNSDDLPRGRALMFEDRLRGVDHAVITEGPVDALKFHLFGGNVCTLGKEVTDRQVGVLVEAGVRRAYLALDPDAWRENERMIRRLRDRGIETLWVDIPEPYEDAGAMSMEDAARAAACARPVTVHNLIVRLSDPRWLPPATI